MTRRLRRKKHPTTTVVVRKNRNILSRLVESLLPKFKPSRPLETKPWLDAQVLVGATKGRVLGQYTIDRANVIIADENGKGKYIVIEPPLTENERSIYRMLMQNVFYGMTPEESSLSAGFSRDYMEGAVWDAARDLGLLDDVKRSASKFMYYTAKDGVGYGKIHVPILDPAIEEISIASYQQPVVVIHKNYTRYGWLETNITFDTEEELRNFGQRLAQRTGKSLTTAMPTVDSFTKDGDRIALAFGDEVTYPGTNWCIRKFPQTPFSLTELVENGTLSSLMAAYLWLVMEMKGFPFVLGPMGAGKSTLLGAVATTIPPTQKIATIEDVLELKLPQPNWIRFHTRVGYSMTETKYDIKPFDLVKLSMRHRPDHIIIGEVRGEEVQALVHSASLGHGGACSMHAYSPDAAITRLSSPPMEITEGGKALIWCFVQLARVQKQTGEWVRRVTEITEVVPSLPISLKQIFKWDPRNDRFVQTTPEKVASESVRLRDAASSRGWTERNLANNLKRRAGFIEQLIKEKRFSYLQFWEELRKFYGR